MNPLSENLAEWLVVVTLTITPVKGKPETLEVGRIHVADRDGCKAWASFTKTIYEAFARDMKRKGKKFKKIRAFKVDHECRTVWQGTRST